MKALKSILAFALGLVCTVALAQDSLKEVVASGNKVYVRIVNDQEHPIPADEIEDVTREFAAAGAWERVEEASEADFILNVEAKKKVVFNSPRTWLTPSVVDKDGNVLWKGDTYTPITCCRRHFCPVSLRVRCRHKMASAVVGWRRFSFANSLSRAYLSGAAV